jgi:hypothetical protein
MTSEPLPTSPNPPIDQTPTTSCASSSSTDQSSTTLPSNSAELLSDEAPLLALLDEDLTSWTDYEKAKARVSALQQARQAPQTLKALLAAESDSLEKRAPKKAPKTPEQKEAAALAKLMSDLL